MKLKRILRQGALLVALFGAVAFVVWSMPQAPELKHSGALTR